MGIGLDISICKGIITKLGGKIWERVNQEKEQLFILTFLKCE